MDADAAPLPKPLSASEESNKKVVTTRVVECKGDICALWNVITDTDRLNRAVGMERLAIEPLSNGSAARFVTTTRLGGFSVEYEELPYEWVYLQTFRVLRRMRKGPVESLQMAFALDRTESGGTNVTLELTMVPRLGLLTPILKLRANQTLRKFEREIRRIDASLEKGGSIPPPAPIAGQVNEAALSRAVDKLSKVGDDGVTSRLVELVRSGSDVDVSRIRPYALADEWSFDRRAVLAACLRAVRAGLLDLRWEVVCPSCRTATDTLPSLAALSQHGACQLCELDFSIDLDEAVEATFAPTKAVREVDAGPYCIGGPSRTPHVVAQAILPPNGSARLVTPEEPGRYRLFVRGGRAVPVEVVEEAPTEVRVDAGSIGEDLRIRVAPGGALEVANASTQERHAKIERTSWARQAATAREVTSMPGFRRDFSSEVLRPGMALRVARVGLFFSDLTASTQLYSRVGDAAAFKLVQDHFEVVIGLVEKHGGTLVKTIGDAVMSVFADEMDGVRASMEILSAFERFRRESETRSMTHIKLGLFAGPCYVVTANGMLDYFGQTVNIAARLQSAARSGELVLEESCAEQAIAAGALSADRIVDRWEARLKGIDEPVKAVRIRA